MAYFLSGPVGVQVGLMWPDAWKVSIQDGKTRALSICPLVASLSLSIR